MPSPARTAVLVPTLASGRDIPECVKESIFCSGRGDYDDGMHSNATIAIVMLCLLGDFSVSYLSAYEDQTLVQNRELENPPFGYQVTGHFSKVTVYHEKN